MGLLAAALLLPLLRHRLPLPRQPPAQQGGDVSLRGRVNGRFVGVQLRFWMQGFIVIAIFMGVGLHALTTTLQLPSVLALLAACLLVLLQLGVNYASVIPITRDNSYLLQYGRAQLEPLPDSSLYIVQGDLQENSILYLQPLIRLVPPGFWV